MPSSDQSFYRFNPDIFESVDAQTFQYAYWESLSAITGQEKGRGTTWFFNHNNHELVLRHYRRGGLVARFNEDWYWWKGEEHARSIHEFKVLQHLQVLNLPAPRPAAAQVIRSGRGYRADLIIERIPKAQDLVSYLQQPQDRSFFQGIGKMVARFHIAKVYHADLNIKNILVDADGKFWLIDFDRAQLNCNSKAMHQQSIDRLKRSFEKEKGRHQIHYQDRDWGELMQGYEQAISTHS